MQSQKIEEDVKSLVENFSEKDFIFDFLLLFGFTKMSIKRLREGNSNLSSKDNQLIIKQKLFYEYSPNDDLYAIIDNLKNDSTTYTHKPRFIVVNNPKKLLAIDTKTSETLDVELVELHKNIDFFLPWTGKEKYVAHQENPADVKAAEKMAHIYDEIVRLNPDLTKKDKNHSLNVFLTRLLFCFFAEDTGIFNDNIFSKTIVNHTKEDGSDLADTLSVLFEALDKKDDEKISYPSYIQEFPYVNGSLFTDKAKIPKLNAKVRKLMIECGDQAWKEINPDIFGSMFQAVSVADVRSGLGQHYTSVPNIMKVIEPLFLNDLKEEYENADTEKKLKKLLNRLYNLKIFDPACGSGNFLIIAYKQLRLLEMDILKKIENITGQRNLMFSGLQLHQFYGIEIDDFACEIATLSLWLAEHQMNRKFKEIFGDCKPALPLSKSGKIVCGNAARLDWTRVCPRRNNGLIVNQMEQMTLSELQETKLLEMQGANNEIYILGNPPYVGRSKRSKIQQQDMDFVFNDISDNYGDLDYIAIWLYKAARYIGNFDNIHSALVATNSICQGMQVNLIWPLIYRLGIHINFAYTSFKWTNNAKNNAGVTCVIIGFSSKTNKGLKTLITGNDKVYVKNINAYLLPMEDVFIEKTNIPISNFPHMTLGCSPKDDGNLLLSESEKEQLLASYPEAEEFVRGYLGSETFLNGEKRYCLLISDEKKDKAMDIPPIKDRIKKVVDFRLKSPKAATQKLASVPHKFGELRYSNGNFIIVPLVSSERRVYIPMGFMNKYNLVSNLAYAVYDAPVWLFGVMSSYIHQLWVKTTGGKMETRIRYSSTLCYNTFPFPEITDKQKQTIEMLVNNILAEREKHSDKTIGDLYDPDKMPQGLREAHNSLDLAIEKCYRQAPFESDEKRLEHLFKRYEIMTDPTKQNNPEAQLSLL